MYRAVADVIDDAVTNGYLENLEMFFNEECIRENVDAIEAFIAANPSVEVGFHKEWSRELSDFDYYEMESWFQGAVMEGQVEVLEWFFAPERRAYMGSTLPHLLANTMDYAIRHDKPDVLDFVLESSVCSALHCDAQKQSLLNELSRSLDDESSDDLLQVLLAHGMDVNNEELLKVVCVEKLSPSQVDAVVAEGACVVGNDLLSRCKNFSNYPSIQRLIHHGAVVSSDTFYAAMTLHDLDDQAWEVDDRIACILIDDGFLDVDEPCRTPFGRGKTPLMTVALSSTNMFGGIVDSAARITRMLLDHGACVSMRDDAVMTVLHHARFNVDILKILHESGVDPQHLEPSWSHRGELMID